MSLVNHLRPGMVVVDVGANLGSLTSQYQQAGATVYAVEPDPRCWKDLSQFVDFDHLIGVALGDTEGALLLHRGKQAAHNSFVLENVIEPEDVAALHVPLATLDSLQAQGRLPAHIDAVKIDAQASEAAILRGASNILRTQRPMWFVEFWRVGLEQAGESVASVRQLFEDADYEPADGQTWDSVCQCANRQTGHGSIDVLLIPKAN